MRQIQYIGEARKWFDTVNGNSYFSVRITRCSDNAQLRCQFEYGYGDQFKQSALEAMAAAGWIAGNVDRFEYDNGYPIYWTVHHVSKKECVAWG